MYLGGHVEGGAGAVCRRYLMLAAAEAEIRMLVDEM
jgi:hypothetical protein